MSYRIAPLLQHLSKSIKVLNKVNERKAMDPIEQGPSSWDI
jgi:hypothetical protein